jgi:methyl acetate hydrolase
MMTTRIDDVLREAMGDAGLPGVVAMAATRDGIIHQAAFGLRNPESGAPMTLDSVARIASMTKAITSVAALRLVERGLLDLDDPICDVLPELTEPMVFERFGVDSRPILHPASVPITLRHLLTHMAGYGYDTWNQPLGHIQMSLGLPRVPTTPDELRRVPLMFEPGTAWNYGINTDIVGRACEVVTGKSLDAVIRDEVTGLLGMADTSFMPGAADEARRFVMHRRAEDGSVVPNPPMPVPETMPFLCGGGGLHSTAPDYLKFVQAILAGGGALLGPEMFAELVRPQTGDISMVPMISAVPAMSNDVVLYPEMALKWSLGFMVNTEQTEEGRSAGGLAWGGLCNTYYWIDLTRGVCGVFMAQLLPFADPATLRAFRAYEAGVYRAI